MLGPDGKPLPVVIDDNIGRFVQGGKYEQPFTVGNYVIHELLRNISQKHIFNRKSSVQKEILNFFCEMLRYFIVT